MIGLLIGGRATKWDCTHRGLNQEDNKAVSFLYDFYSESIEEIINSENDYYSRIQCKNLVHKYRALLMTKAYSALCDLYYKAASDMPGYKSSPNKEILQKIFECMKMVDIRTLYVETTPSLEKIKNYRPTTLAMESIETMIESNGVIIPLKKGFIFISA